eukprot:1727604-Alexandrium_andersonii.AAC.1
MGRGSRRVVSRSPKSPVPILIPSLARLPPSPPPAGRAAAYPAAGAALNRTPGTLHQQQEEHAQSERHASGKPTVGPAATFMIHVIHVARPPANAVVQSRTPAARCTLCTAHCVLRA